MMKSKTVSQFVAGVLGGIDKLIRKLIYLVRVCEKEPKLSKKTIREIKEVRERIKKGEFYTEEVRKILG